MAQRSLARRVRFRGGAVELRASGDTLYLEALSCSIEFRPRAIVVRGGVSGFEEMEYGRSRRRKCLYLRLKREIEPFSGRGQAIDRMLIGSFEARYQSLGFDEFLTILMPGTHLYDYAIVSSSVIAVVYSFKRRAYVDREDSTATVYMV